MVTWKNIMPRVHRWTIFMDENVDENEMDEHAKASLGDTTKNVTP